MAALLACGVMAAGCGGGGGSGGSMTSLGVSPGTYVGTDYNSATMVTINRDSGGGLSGTMDSKTEGQSPVSVTLTVSVSGSRFTFGFPTLGTAETLSGTIRGRDLHMRSPQPNGVIEDYVLHPGTVDDYNAAIQKMNLR
ncbi:hypothetical protein [Streptomyces sp. NPDC049040]|uniref:hypothetical protein n=1 Tax=Streptomyces sp. NPDC049040 TaxID=3365593 RepID=UPI0037247049